MKQPYNILPFPLYIIIILTTVISNCSSSGNCSNLLPGHAETTNFHIAAKNGDMIILKKLIDSSLDINQLNAWGWTPVYLAVHGGHTETVNFLLKNGACADINTGRGGNSPLHYSASLGYTEISSILIKYGADIEKRNNYDFTPLHMAVKNSQADTLKLLIKNKAAVNSKTNRGSTPLHWSVFNGSRYISEILLKSGADPGIPDNEGRTPLDTAKEKKNPEIIRILESYSKQRSSSR